MPEVERSRAVSLAVAWIEAFNAHRADAVVAHFAEDVTVRSPRLAALRPDSGGEIQGRHAVLGYYQEGLVRVPDLHFELVEVLTGIDQITILYRDQRGVTVAETLTLGADETVARVEVTYGPSRPSKP